MRRTRPHVPVTEALVFELRTWTVDNYEWNSLTEILYAIEDRQQAWLARRWYVRLWDWVRRR